MDPKKVYYYIICLVALLVLFWGAVDLTSSLIGLAGARPTLAPSIGEGDQSMDLYYQKKMLYDRLSDSLARIIIAGLVFGYSRIKINRLEK
jgi:hypothetical protein